MFLRTVIAAVLGCSLLSAPIAARAADRGPSTPEERKHALEYIAHFEADPLNPTLKPEIQWLTIWVIQVPDVHVSLCTFVGLSKGNKKDSQTLFTAMMFAQVGYALRNPYAPADHLGEYQAGIEGMLRAYEKVLKTNEKDRQATLDDLIQRRDTGTLAQWVREHAATSCKN